jgi:iron-sulfur cluster repair protein YtfE (RIC family)
MRANFDQNTVSQVMENIPQSNQVFRTYHIEVATGRNLRLNDVAQSVSVPTEEMLAVMEYRVRQAARQHR